MRSLRHLRIVASSAFACALVALCLAGIAGADTSTVLTDPAGDGGSGVDITRLEIESYDQQGGLTFWIRVNGFFACSSDGDGEPAMVALDLDQNPDTGSAYYGTEVAFAPAGPVGDPQLLRADGWDLRGARNQLGLGGGCGPGTGIYSIDLSKLGLEEGAGFNVVVAALGSAGDTAPDVGTFNYQQVPGAKPPPLGRDRRAPHVSAFASVGVHGKRATLRYWALDGRGKTREIVRIFRGERLLRTVWTPLHNTNPFRTAQLDWKVPQGIRGKLRFSVRSIDAAGNRSNRAWASLDVR
jgi:hypothetical protein